MAWEEVALTPGSWGGSRQGIAAAHLGGCEVAWVLSARNNLTRASVIPWKTSQPVAGGRLEVLASTHGAAIPEALALQGYDHLGDIDVATVPGANGRVVFAAVEDDAYAKPAVLAFSLEDFTFLGVPALLRQQSHAPWVAVREEAGTLVAYSSEFDAVTRIFRYAMPGSLMGEGASLQAWELDLPEGHPGLMRIQGGDFAPDGALLLTSDDASQGRPIYTLRPEGAARSEGPRTAAVTSTTETFYDAEMEGLTLLELPGGCFPPGRLHWVGGSPRSYSGELNIHHWREAATCGGLGAGGAAAIAVLTLAVVGLAAALGCLVWRRRRSSAAGKAPAAPGAASASPAACPSPRCC